MLFSQFLILNHNNYVISCWVLTEVDKENGRREPCYDSINLLYRLVHIDKKEGKKKLFIAIRRYHLKFFFGVFKRLYSVNSDFEECLSQRRQHLCAKKTYFY